MPPRSKIHFVTVTDPGRSSVTKAQRAVHSHAAREAHARARRQRVKEYQERNGTQNGTQNGTSEGALSAGGIASLVQIDPCTVRDGVIRGEDTWSQMPLNLALSGCNDPFYATERPLSKQERFLFHHYLTCVIPQMGDLCPKLELYDGLLSKWLSLILSNARLLHCTLLTASRHLQVYHWLDSYSRDADRKAGQYKLICLEELTRHIRAEAVTKRFDISTIAQAFALALDEMSFGELKIGHGYFGHIVKMVEANGGAASLKGNDFVHHMYLRLIQGKLVDEYLYETY